MPSLVLIQLLHAIFFCNLYLNHYYNCLFVSFKYWWIDIFETNFSLFLSFSLSVSVTLYLSSETVWFWLSLVQQSSGFAWQASSCRTEVTTGATSRRGQNSSQDKRGPKPPTQSLTKSGSTSKKTVGQRVCDVFIRLHNLLQFSVVHAYCSIKRHPMDKLLFSKVKLKQKKMVSLKWLKRFSKVREEERWG